MTNRKAMEIVLDMANELRETCKVQREDVEMEAIYQMQDYMNDLMRLEDYSVDVKEIERHRELEIGPDGTVMEVK